jgi:hypothetical protein
MLSIMSASINMLIVRACVPMIDRVLYKETLEETSNTRVRGMFFYQNS